MQTRTLVTTLSDRGYGIDKNSLDEKRLEDLRTELTVAPYTGGPSPGLAVPRTPIALFLESSKKLYVPKYFGLQRFGEPTSIKYPPTQAITQEIKFAGSLRPEQEEPIAQYMEAARDPKQRGGIINLSCGQGKTVIALYIVSQLATKTLIVVHKDFLLDQWRERISTFLPKARVGLIKAKVIDVEDKEIVIASLQSLSMKSYEPQVFDGIGFLIIDEVHRTGTEVFSQALKKLNVMYTLGLSATVTRKDGMSKVFKYYIGDIVNKKGKRKQQQVYVDVLNYWANDRSYNKEETIGYTKLNFSRMISNICEHEPRTKLIAKRIMNYIRDPAAAKRRKILVLSERKNHLAAIKGYLHDLDPTITTGFYIGGMKSADLQISQGKDVILATFAFASEGFDAKELDTLILATPKTDIEQSVGRILRATESDRVNVPTILDVVDTFSVFERQGSKRQQFYKKCGYTLRGTSPFSEIADIPQPSGSDSSGAFLPDEE